MPSEEPHCAYFIRPQIYAKACSTQKIESILWDLHIEGEALQINFFNSKTYLPKLWMDFEYPLNKPIRINTFAWLKTLKGLTGCLKRKIQSMQ